MTDTAQMEILKPGPLSSIQDGGRIGVAHLGLSQGGALDRHAWAWSNYLLGNPYGCAVAEITLGGFKAHFNAPTQIALTGADVPLFRNGEQLPHWCTHAIAAGDVIELGMARVGMRAYLAIRHGWQTCSGPGNSRSTLLREGLGGPFGTGAPLQAGDRLNYVILSGKTEQRGVPPRFQPDYGLNAIDLEFWFSAQAQGLTPKQRSQLLTQEWQLSARSGRMAALLEGKPLTLKAEALASEGIALGAVQLPADGLPIILLQERQTLGGYPKPGYISARSLDRLAQARPGTQLRLRETDYARAQRREQQFLRFFRAR